MELNQGNHACLGPFWENVRKVRKHMTENFTEKQRRAAANTAAYLLELWQENPDEPALARVWIGGLDLLAFSTIDGRKVGYAEYAVAVQLSIIDAHGVN